MLQNLLKEGELNCAGILSLSFHTIFEALGMLQEVAGRNSYFSPVECQRGKKINLNTTKGNYVFMRRPVVFSFKEDYYMSTYGLFVG